jgi:hypothetical protein
MPYMRVLFRITLTLLIALPAVLGLAVVFALQVLRGAAPAPEENETLPSERGGLGQKRAAT